MQWRIITVGKPALSWAKAGFEDYLSRLRRMARVEHVAVKDGPRDLVDARMLTASDDGLRIILDERGRALRSLELAAWTRRQEVCGTKRACLLIGGAEGHGELLRASADECWTLSKFTLQHEVALVVLAEQIYRAYSILRGEPYHRE
ncbi:MAG TPA: 50S rRNA methyltransferase [Verrucomicrobiales bacterium]|nr:50S rRNA methyltransferase [Verrucomicrobiales bacterium]